MLKMTLGGILCFISAYLGIVGKNYYEKRYKYLASFNDYLLALVDGISYSKDRLPEISKKYLAQSKGGFSKDLQSFISVIERVGEEEKIENCFNCKYLKKQDKAYFNDFFSSLGKVDYDTQLSKLNMSKAEMEKILAKAEKDKKTTGNVLSKLGLLIGITIMIILV
ncbi:MAG: stage III sporulation protein AB [Clostridia bacterium]|nr:stage III sporulation protein AB [Clostridia bacterium]MDE7328670.1 stage III sporulation protein AB [Clostridia bacterium]